MRIATWNTRRGRAEIKLPVLIERYDPDLVAIQEIAIPNGEYAEQSLWAGSNPNQGILIWAKNHLMLKPLPRFKCDTNLYQAARVFCKNRFLFNVFNLWVVPFQNRPRGDCAYGYSLTTGLDLFASRMAHEASIVLGDSNILNPESKQAYSEDLEKLGLFSAYHAWFNESPGYEKQKTHLHSSSKTLHHIDWLYLPIAWRKSVESVQVGEQSDWESYSDHFPIVVDVNDKVLSSK